MDVAELFKRKKYRIEFGKRLKYFRKRASLNQEQLWRPCGYTSSGTISQIERGIIGMEKSNIQLAADALGIPVFLLYSEKKYSEKQLQIIINCMSLIENSKKSKYYDAIESLLKQYSQESKSPKKK